MANFKLRQLEEERKWREIGLRRTLNEADFIQVKQMCEDQAERVFTEVRKRQIRKFEGFQQKVSNTTERDTATKRNWVYNFSKHNLQPAEERLLQRGLNFAEAPKRVAREDIIVGVESALRNCNDREQAERARAAIAGILKRAQPPASNITTDERSAMASLRANKEIVILPADKGNATIVLDTAEYHAKALDILSKHPFRRLEGDPTRKNEKRVNDMLKNLHASGELDATTASSLRAPLHGTRPPMFYGTVKLHKKDHPLRPIVSAVGSATYQLAKFISQLLTPFHRETESLIINTQDFINQLKEVTLEEDDVLVSYDVKSLFTSVPVQAAMDAIRSLLEADQSFEERNKIKVRTVLKLLHVCLVTTNFRFLDKHYELVDGLAMGSPVSPIVANLFMAKLESHALTTFVSPPKVWLRFVDDIFSIVKGNTVRNLLEHLNSQNPSITFTTEQECDGSIPFMDVNVRRQGTKLLTDVYRKPTHTGRYLSHSSHHPPSAKRSVVTALMNRKSYITTGDKARKEEDSHVRNELAANQYPQNFIERATKPRQKAATTKQYVATATIPYSLPRHKRGNSPRA